MALDMMGMMLRGMGIDADAILQQAAGLGAAFERMNAQLDAIRAGQDAIMAAMGLYVAPPEGDVAALIAAESIRHLDRYGGAVRAPFRVDSDALPLAEAEPIGVSVVPTIDFPSRRTNRS